MLIIKPNATLDKLCRFLNSVRGTDKVLMLIQYASKIINWHLRKLNPSSNLAARIANLSSPVSDFRILLRYYGLIPLIQWISYSEAHPSPNAQIQWLTRAQNFVNVLYYPLEHAYWLGLHQIIPMKDSTRDKIGMWSCRAWAAYVVFSYSVLYFYQLYEEHKALKKRESSYIKKLKDGIQDTNEEIAIKEEKDAIFMNTIINAAYFPLTIHWSLETSSFPDVGVGIFGTIAALAQLKTAWKAS